jgi:hypothetical protein
MSEDTSNERDTFVPVSDAVKAAIREQMTTAGYAEFPAGGGLMVWNRDISKDRYFWISTDDSDIYGSPNANIWVAGSYGKDGWIAIASVTLDDALDILPRLRAPRSGEEVVATKDEVETLIEAQPERPANQIIDRKPIP